MDRVLFYTTFSPESNCSFNDFHDVPLGGVMNMPCVVRPLSLIRDRMSLEGRKWNTCHWTCSKEHYLLMRTRPMVCTGAVEGLAWTKRTLNWLCASIFSSAHPTLMLTLKDHETHFFNQIFLRRARNESCETYQNCCGPFTIMTKGTQLFSKEFSSINCWDSVQLVLVRHRTPMEAGCQRSCCLLRYLSFASKEEMRSLPGIV